ncbi:DUF397 domain-containing protein [Streptomyces hyaluromycini]|uniref:DUF397 domain-containing protein n=1 Tax=Streptomyces hyaluromycini TaxID=1377993 RepID=UPI000B5C9AD3|nr:DUF397 domain-containing protein [Streptomyces hyaluromycini]
MTTSDHWRKSSYSEGGDGNECVEIATTPTRTAVRDSKAPAARTLTFPAGAFAAFVEGITAVGLPGRRPTAP